MDQILSKFWLFMNESVYARISEVGFNVKFHHYAYAHIVICYNYQHLCGIILSFCDPSKIDMLVIMFW